MHSDTSSPTSRSVLVRRASTPARSAVSGLVLSLALMAGTSVMAAPHKPLSKKDGKASIHAPAQMQANADLLGEPKGSEVAQEIEALVMDGVIAESLGGKVSKGAQSAARQAYAQSVFAPLWTRDAADKLLKINTHCEQNGFASGFTDAQIAQAIEDRFSNNADARARADLRLSATWLSIVSEMSGGLSDEGGMVKSTTARPTRSDLVTALRNAAIGDPVAEMEGFASLSPQYDALKKALKTYKKHSALGGWKRMPEGDDMLEPGMTDPRVPALRERLRAEGYVPPRRYAALSLDTDVEPDLYDPMLEAQLKTFQATHGLQQDGILGPSTLAALNESVDSKVAKIERAMDHWRRNANPGDQHIWVNIPSYRAEAWKDGERQIVQKTVVGKSRTPSTAFSDEIEYIVVNPKWFLPIGLFKRQKLHKLRKDPGYAARKKYQIFDRASGAQVSAHDIDWTEPGVARRIQMVQTPGPHNALGQLKIIFPNKHAIYLHDTPDRHLFDRDVRALSSGCIRLEDPVAMANWLTDNDSAVATTVFNSVLESRERERFYLDHHVDVHLTYLPAVVSPDGLVEFPADIYQNFKAPKLAKDVYALDKDIDETETGYPMNLVEEAGSARDFLQ